MQPARFRGLKYVCLSCISLLLLSGADCESPLQCSNGPSGALRILSGKNAALGTSDNSSFVLTIVTPDPYVGWKDDGDVGQHSIDCFVEYWDQKYGDKPRSAVVWSGSGEPACATISSLKYADDGSVSAVLERPDEYSPAPTVSGDVVIEINRECSFAGSCNYGLWDTVGNCFQPFFSPEENFLDIAAPRAILNFASFDSVRMPYSDLSETILSNASFSGATLTGSNFRNAVMMQTDFSGADMTDVKAEGAWVYQTIAPNGATVNDYESLLHNLQ